MRIRVSDSEMACILALKQACFHNGHNHIDLWTFGLREILGKAIPLVMGTVEFEVVVTVPERK